MPLHPHLAEFGGEPYRLLLLLLIAFQYNRIVKN